MHYGGVSTHQFLLYYAGVIHKHTHILRPFEDSEPTVLKVDLPEFLDNEKYTSNSFITTVLLCICCILHEKTVHDQDDVYMYSSVLLPS